MHEQPDSEIDCWFVGGDCVGWFYARLLCLPGIGPCLSPVMEDWGWTAVLTANEIPVSINVWAYDPIPHCWLLGIEPRAKRLFRRYPDADRSDSLDLIVNGLKGILDSDSRFTSHRWLNTNPFDTGLATLVPDGG